MSPVRKMSVISGPSPHQWKRLFTPNVGCAPPESRMTFYRCVKCRHLFTHYYHLISDIYKAMASSNVPMEECNTIKTSYDNNVDEVIKELTITPTVEEVTKYVLGQPIGFHKSNTGGELLKPVLDKETWVAWNQPDVFVANGEEKEIEPLLQKGFIPMKMGFVEWDVGGAEPTVASYAAEFIRQRNIHREKVNMQNAAILQAHAMTESNN